MKKYILILLCLMASIGAQAQFSGSGSGTSSDPYLIFNPTQLAQMANFLNNTNVVFELKNDINLTEFISDNYPTEGWVPIGVSSSPFEGTLKGNNHTISGVSINRPSTEYVGLFGYLNGAKIENLTLEASTVKGGAHTGVFAGYATDATLKNIHVTATGVNGGNYTGGFIGQTASSTINTLTLTVSGTGVSGSSYVGGFVGSTGANFTNCSVKGNVVGTSTYVGGFAGNASTSVFTACNQYGDVRGTGRVGGICGYSEQAPTFADCKSQGKITSTGDYAGGVLGYGDFVSMTNCSHFGDIQGTNYVGGVYGGGDKGEDYPVYYWSTSNTSNTKGGSWTNTSRFITGNVNTRVVNKCTAIGNMTGAIKIGGLVGSHEASRTFRMASVDKSDYGGEISDRNNGWTCLWRGNSYAHLTGYSFSPTDYVDYTTLNVANSYYSGNVTGTDNVGGLIGNKVCGELKNCYAYANVVGETNVGGLIGNAVGAVGGNVGTLTVKSSAAINTTVNATKNNVGRIYGYKADDYVTIGALGTAEGNLSINNTSVVKSGVVQTITDDLQNGTSIGQSMLKLKATYVAKGWNFDEDWTVQETESYPYMRYQAAPPVIESKLVSGATTISGRSIDGGAVYLYYKDGEPQSQECGAGNTWSFTTEPLQSGAEVRLYAEKENLTPSYFATTTVGFPGSGKENDPYLIYSAADLQGVSKQGYYKLMNDIDLTAWIAENSPSKGWVSIGRNGTEATYIDGDGHKITGLWTNTTDDYTGLFSNFSSGSIKNLTVEVASGKKVEGGNYTGILIGRNANGTIQNVIVKGDVQGTQNVGGVMGYSEKNTLNIITYEGQVSASADDGCVGGIAGYAVGCTTTLCRANATIKSTGASTCAGGIAGYADGCTTTLCRANATIKSTGASTYAGGIYGRTNHGVSISKTTANSNIDLEAQDSYAGGLVGRNYSNIEYSFATGTIKAMGENSYAGGIAGLTGALITDCYSTAEVQGNLYASGIAAYSLHKISRCYASGNVSGVFNGAGITAQLDGTRISEGYIPSVQNSVAVNNQLTFTDQSSWASRVIGGYKNGAADPDNSNYALKTMQVTLNGVPTKKYDDIVEGIAKEESMLKTAAFYTGIGWDMTDIWTIDEGTGYPTLVWETPDAPTPATYTITATADESMGTVTGAGEYTEGDEVTLTATAAEGYEFVNWSDGTTENPYVFTASEDKTLTATFKKKETPIGPEPDPDSDILPSTDVSTLPYALYFNDEERRAGDFPLELNMKNAEENITAFQCDVYLPEGIVWKSTTDKRGKVTYNAPTFNEDRTDLSYHTIAPMAKNADGSYNIIVYSMDKETILETDGALLTLPLEIPEDMPTGDYNIIVRNIVMTNINTEQTKVDEVVSRLTIPSYTIGDANGDDEINVTDIVYIISYIREEVPEGFVAAAADVNADNEVNVTDIVGVIDLIRDPGAGAYTRAMHVKKAALSATSNLDVLPFTLTQGTTTANVQLNMNNPGDEFTAFQCDIQLPEGINWAYTVDKRGNKKYTQPTFNAEADRTDATYHTVSAGINQGDGSMNIIVYSMEKETFLDEEGAILDMPFMFDANLAPGIYDVVVKNVVMTRPNNTQIKPADYTFSIMVGSPATEVAALKGRYNAEVLSEFSTALSTNASICAVDLTNADVDAANATLSLGNENALIYLAEGSAIANTKNVVVDGECANLVQTDDYAFHAPMPFEATDASYSRSVATDGWYSIVLPFAAEIPSGVSVEKFQSLDEAGSVATFTQVMTMEGDMPYIYHASAGNIGFTAQNVEVAATPSEIADGALKGTYSTLEAGSVTGSYVLRGDGTGFGVCDATAYVPAFRAYLQAGGGASNVRIYHDRLTGIHAATSASSDVIYDLCGRRVNKEAKGVVLMNRNKQIKK